MHRHGPSIGDWPYDYIQMCKRLVKNKDAPAFMHPVDPQADGCQDYLEVMRDFKMQKSKLKLFGTTTPPRFRYADTCPAFPMSDVPSI